MLTVLLSSLRICILPNTLVSYIRILDLYSSFPARSLKVLCSSTIGIFDSVPRYTLLANLNTYCLIRGSKMKLQPLATKC